MVQVKGTKGNLVSFQISGIAETVRMLNAAGKKIEAGADLGVVRAGTFVTEEVKESVSGKRAETKSVDTGHFVTDVKFDKTGKAEGKVHAPNTPYVKFLELGTSRLSPRSHFRNTRARTREKVKDIIQKEIGFG